ncbi:hypothetical protein BJX68DRAFT_265113 [Aspergillus pseudodeflectus]|uniref:Uncharacterized protein n=1 Tax=Aspergillus pseudodeflectus TaxID=176178 RepID=A0ABR4KMZ5_9EURO
MEYLKRTIKQHIISETPRTSTKNMLHPIDYKLGWICALDVDYIAAVSMLDEQHQAPSRSSQDQNTYTLGRIQHTNIVIIRLPDSSVSTSSAIATMRSTFPGLRASIVVGITDYTLQLRTETGEVKPGDVIISKPTQLRPAGVIPLAGVSGGRLQATPDRLHYAWKEANARRAMCAEDPVILNIRRLDGKIRGLNVLSLDARSQMFDAHGGLIASSGPSGSSRAMIDVAAAREKNLLCSDSVSANVLSVLPGLVIRGVAMGAVSDSYAAGISAAYARQICLYFVIKGEC